MVMVIRSPMLYVLDRPPQELRHRTQFLAIWLSTRVLWIKNKLSKYISLSLC
jgi:hypothetical protein